MSTSPNNLIRATRTSTNKLTVKLYVQFIIDRNTFRTMPYQNADTYVENIFPKQIYIELARCWDFPCMDCQVDMALADTMTTLPNENLLRFRPAALQNPFQPNAPPFTDTYPVTTTNWPVLPLVRFYIGDGESLNLDIQGMGLDQPISDSLAKQRLSNNLNNNLAGVIPGFGFYYGNRISFFSRALRAGYLFTDGKDLPAITFMHELGHILGMSDRYIEGVDESSVPDGLLSFVGKPDRGNPPLSKKFVNFVLRGGTSGPDLDTDYNPQRNLMSSRTYALSSFQRSIIENQLIEPTYVDDNVMLLLSQNEACKRDPTEVVVNPGAPCRVSETPYHPSAIYINATTLAEATFETPTKPRVLHNAFFRTSPGSLLPVRYQGQKAALKKLKSISLLPYGIQTKNIIYKYLKKQ